MPLARAQDDGILEVGSSFGDSRRHFTKYGFLELAGGQYLQFTDTSLIVMARSRHIGILCLIGIEVGALLSPLL